MHRFRMPSPLVEFAYVSAPAIGIPSVSILRLAGQAWSYNRRAGITGWLRFEDGRFRQVLEGPSDVVLPLSSRILADARHGDIEISAFGPIAERRYFDWSLIGFEGLAANAPGADVGLRVVAAGGSVLSDTGARDATQPRRFAAPG